ncbi:MAG: TRAM domain-containing protein [Polyangia bacterium]
MPELRLRIESLGKGGDSVGRADDGRVVFVDGGVPGDLVLVELTEQKARYCRGTVTAVLEPGTARVPAPCVYAERCGGCPWQSVAMRAQLEAKQQIVERALRKLGAPVEALLPSPASLGYRGRATMSVRRGKLGFFGRRSHEVVEVESCLALEPALDRALQGAMQGLPRELGEEGSLRGTCALSGVHLSMTPGRGADLAALHARAQRLVDEGVIGVLVDGRVFGAPLLDAGSFLVSAAGFRQANASQNEVLRRLVTELLEPAGTSVLELYCGDGNFTRDLAAAKKVIAVEEDAPAIQRLRKNVPSATAVNARVERDVQQRAQRGERFDRVLLDPPRAGAKEAVPAIAKLGADRIVYVSCDVATLARDLDELAMLGYRTSRIVPIDLMPHTDHVEVVVLLLPIA